MLVFLLAESEGFPRSLFAGIAKSSLVLGWRPIRRLANRPTLVRSFRLPTQLASRFQPVRIPLHLFTLIKIPAFYAGIFISGE
jgi:hypothetical protein